MRYLLIEKTTDGRILQRESDELMFKDLHAVREGKVAIYRGSGSYGYSYLVLPEDWGVGEMTWNPVANVKEVR